MKKQKRRELDLETISKFCGLTIKDLDMEKRIINIDHQLQRDFKMEYHVHSTKTNAGTRKIPMTQEVYEMFQTILEDREPPAREIMVDDMLPSYRTMKYKSPIWGYFHVQKE